MLSVRRSSVRSHRWGRVSPAIAAAYPASKIEFGRREAGESAGNKRAVPRGRSHGPHRGPSEGGAERRFSHSRSVPAWIAVAHRVATRSRAKPEQTGSELG